jgi:hypothetical protein
MLASTIPFVGLFRIASSGQMLRAQYSGSFAHSDFASAAVALDSATNKFPVHGWLQKTIISTSEVTAFNAAITTVFTLKKSSESDLGSGGTLKATDLAGALVNATSPEAHFLDYRPVVMYHGGFTENENRTRATTTHMMWLEARQGFTLEIAAVDLNTAPSAGVLQVRVDFIFIIASMTHPGKGGNPSGGNSFLFLGVHAETDEELFYTYVSPVNLRLYSIEVMTSSIGEGMVFYFGRHDPGVSSQVAAHTADDWATGRYAMAMPDNEILIWRTDAGDPSSGDPQQPAFLKHFVKGPLFLKKSEPWDVRFDPDYSADSSVHLIAQVMPDYKNRFSMNVTFNVETGQETGVDRFRFPFDVYLETIESEVWWTDADAGTPATVTHGYIDIHGIKSGNFDTGSAARVGAIISTVGTSTTEGVESPSILDRIIISSSNPADGRTSMEMVNDYFEQGSHIFITSNGLAEADSMLMNLQIEGHIPRKQGKKDTLAAYIEGDNIFNFGGELN